MTGFPRDLNHQHLQWVLYPIAFHQGTVTVMLYVLGLLSVLKAADLWEMRLYFSWKNGLFKSVLLRTIAHCIIFILIKKIPEHEYTWYILLGCDTATPKRSILTQVPFPLLFFSQFLISYLCAAQVGFFSKTDGSSGGVSDLSPVLQKRKCKALICKSLVICNGGCFRNTEGKKYSNWFCFSAEEQFVSMLNEGVKTNSMPSG